MLDVNASLDLQLAADIPWEHMAEMPGEVFLSTTNVNQAEFQTTQSVVDVSIDLPPAEEISWEHIANEPVEAAISTADVSRGLKRKNDIDHFTLFTTNPSQLDSLFLVEERVI